MTFQRARSEEQRESRRRTILDTAAAMLAEMPVAGLNLNELSRRVGLAKSNVLRYFESREAVLLELMNAFLGDWLDEVADELDTGIEPHASPEVRARQLAEVLIRSLARQTVLCDLFGAQGGVLEHNVSVEVVKRHKRPVYEKLSTMADLVRRHLPQIGDDALMFCLMSLTSAGAPPTYVPPPPSLLAAYAEDPDLGAMHVELRDTLQSAVSSTLLGVLPRY